MARKRKVRASEPEPEPEPEPQAEEQSQDLQQEEAEKPQSQDPVKEDERPEAENMIVDDNTKEDPQPEPEDEPQPEPEEEPRPEQEEEPQPELEEKEAKEPETGVDPSEDAAPPESTQTETNGSGENGNADAENKEVEEEELEEEPLETILDPFNKDQLVSLLKQAVDKYPDLIDSVQAIADADPAHRKIFVHGLGWDTTAETLTAEFGKYGEIEDCKAVTDRVSGKSKGYAFILFKHRSGARKALKQPQKKIGNRITSCQLASAGPVPAPLPSTPPVSEYTQRKIFISNVSADIDSEKLTEFFRRFGEIEEGPLGLDKHTGKPKGFALFVYKTIEGSRKALEEPHKNFEGHMLHCQRAIDGPKPNKQGYGGTGGHHHQQNYQQHHYQQPHHHSKKGKYTSAGPGPARGHLMAPSGPAVGFNPGVAPQPLNPALGQALTALLATQGAGLGIGNLLGGIAGATVNQGGPPGGYGNQPGGYGSHQPGMQGGYQNPQMGPSSGGRPPHGGAPYMGH
ncbi:hypothetical protein HS088_TW02G00664 [Tripterygium wilfordii]|uniref:RRM domain-containing protein n=1 Tax=Tripterygium wilfordii TaxID=458696 RepID=A0A7J7DZ61_TRIWF|nr:UBP1-associated protein 2B-like [Tripterygium wilfordii]XP_038719074.1 UBP1-associated protein 2B-like [Tripterygium wilfordii]KAF5751648.1 hypothetical protein HS088_TW02G00664 [Tripterygium wilfordii]